MTRCVRRKPTLATTFETPNDDNSASNINEIIIYDFILSVLK